MRGSHRAGLRPFLSPLFIHLPRAIILGSSDTGSCMEEAAASPEARYRPRRRRRPTTTSSGAAWICEVLDEEEAGGDQLPRPHQMGFPAPGPSTAAGCWEAPSFYAHAAAQSTHVPLGALLRPPGVASAKSLTPAHSPHARQVPKQGTGPGTTHTDSRSGSQQAVQSTPRRSLSARQRTVLRAGAVIPHPSQRI